MSGQTFLLPFHIRLSEYECVPHGIEPGESKSTTRVRGWLQLLLGQLQVGGATAGALLLLSSGVNNLTLSVVAGTFLATAMSRLAFHGDAVRLRNMFMPATGVLRL